MITKEQALTEREFHEEMSASTCRNWRRNGKTQTWKTRPEDFRLPVKFGLYGYGAITADNASEFHTASECPNKAVTDGT